MPAIAVTLPAPFSWYHVEIATCNLQKMLNPHQFSTIGLQQTIFFQSGAKKNKDGFHAYLLLKCNDQLRPSTLHLTIFFRNLWHFLHIFLDILGNYSLIFKTFYDIIYIVHSSIEIFFNFLYEISLLFIFKKVTVEVSIVFKRANAIITSPLCMIFSEKI